jgi:hypothetical protein
MPDREHTDIVVNIIDFSALEKAAAEKYSKEHPDKKNVECTVLHKWGFVETPAGTFMLDNEGIIHTNPLSEDHKVSIDIHASWDGERGRGMSFGPVLEVHLSDLEEFSSSEKVDLGQFVRTFGSRLESNFLTCKKVLEVKLGRREPEVQVMGFQQMIEYMGITMESLSGERVAEIYKDIVGDTATYSSVTDNWSVEVY